MKAFEVSPHLSPLMDSYPDASVVADAAKYGGKESKEAIARLWLSEGIPFAFKTAPALYEVVRTWLGAKLKVDPKEIHLSGSARLGQSLAPYKRGTVFGKHSDLDFFIVSSDLFSRLEVDFNNWSSHYENGTLHPSVKEAIFWEDNNKRGKIILGRGFIDSKMIPNRNEYSSNKIIAQSMWELKQKLDATQCAPAIKSASVRCYKDWKSYVRQVVLSLN
ncbi:Uncharacterised protein [Yersinia intermedia]|uniref:hypothetical protein n=1 Tax=Yersinia intermedia TaxID=631 RepID=UPI0005E4076D|nr:hypothetical protein [Yersinia intermedia]MDA5512655.1 hypothetical protein [Yersinia intermedia]CNH46195.1 Uncharacterised protein [Yersinia intermedia]CQD77438.1 Uncharacterised protein [Yersinia intermedia]